MHFIDNRPSRIEAFRNYKRIKNFVVASLFGAVIATSAQADIGFTSACFANAANPTVTAWCSSCGGSYSVSDVFTLGAAADVSGMDFAIQARYGSAWNIQVGVWDTALATQLFSVKLAPSDYTLAQLGNNVAMVSASFAGPSLAAARPPLPPDPLIRRFKWTGGYFDGARVNWFDLVKTLASRTRARGSPRARCLPWSPPCA